MSILLFANNAATTIAGAITNTALTVNLAPGAGALFPSPGAGQYFLGTFNDAATGLLTEIVQVTARSGDTLTIVRAQEGTTAQAWNSGDLFSNLWTAGSAAQMLQQGQVPSASLVNYGVDTGTADAINATLTPTVTSLTAGLLVEITPAFANATTTPTMNASGLGAKSIVRFDGSAVQAGDIQPAPAKAMFIYDLSSLQFLLINPTQRNGVQHYGLDSGAANAYVVSATAPGTFALSTGIGLKFKVAGGNTSTGASTINVNSLGATAIKRADGSAVKPGDIMAGEIVSLTYDGTNFQIDNFLVGPTDVLAKTLIAQTANGSYTWTCPANTIKAYINVTGAGGGGAGSGGATNGGGCGGAGGTAEGWVTVVPGTVYTYVIGAGGTAGGTGGTGGSSTGFGFTATGGVGGANTGGAVGGGSGGVGSGGTLNLHGGYGTDGVSAMPAGVAVPSGGGGASKWGGGGRAAIAGGIAGQAPGTGGGAAYSGTGTGGAGADGLVTIYF